MYLGLDLGTSGLKALLLDEEQNMVASADAALNVSRPQHGWSEQAPDDWICAAKKAIASLRHSHPMQLSAVRGIGLSGQQHGATLLDATDQPLRPCILWNDVRAHLEAQIQNANPLFAQHTGNLMFPGFTAPKLSWCAANEASLFKKVQSVLLPKDYLRMWLCADKVSDLSDASGTGWLDIAARAWSEPLLAATDLQLSHMPRLVEGTEVSGQLRRELADSWGIKHTVVIAGGAGDNAASACGMGIVKPQSAFASLGTSGVLFVSNAQFAPNPASAVHAFCHALPNRWHQMGVILSATESLNWYASVAGKSAAQLTAALGETLQAPTGINFLPYLSGERTPHNDAHIRGAFVGLTADADSQRMTQAVLEGVCFAFADCLQALQAAGTEIERITAVGGGSRSSYWLKSLATALNTPVDVPHDGDYGAAFGAARLGMIAATGADPTTVCVAPKIAYSVIPEAALLEPYQVAWQRYRALYPALSGIKC